MRLDEGLVFDLWSLDFELGALSFVVRTKSQRPKTKVPNFVAKETNESHQATWGQVS